MKIFTRVCGLFITVLMAAPAFAAELPVKKICYLSDGPNPHVERVAVQIKSELTALAKGRYAVQFLPDQQAGWSAETAERLVKQALADPSVHLVLVSGVEVSKAVLTELPLTKPVIVADFVDTELLGFPVNDKGASGVTHLYHISKTKGAAADFAAFRRIISFGTLHVLIEDSYRPFTEQVLAKAGKLDFEVKLISAAGKVADVLSRLDGEKIQALYLPPLRFSDAELQQLIDGFNQRSIPTFTAFGADQVEKGVLAARVPKIYSKFARRVALTVDRVLSGEDAGSIPVEFDVDEKTVINQRTADHIGVSIPFDVLLEADVMFSGESAAGDVLTLGQAVRESLSNNLNFKILDEQINVARKDYSLQLTNYLPGVNFELDYQLNDSERAQFSPGVAKRSTQYGLTLEQLVFSHPVFVDIVNSKKQIEVQRLQRRTAELDITDLTIRAYLDYLTAKALHKVELDNLKAVEANLTFAEKRYQTGAGGREEVLRWESERAEKKSNILKRESDIYQTRTILNQLMNRPQEQLFLEQEVGLETVQFYIGSQYMEPYVQNFKAMLGLLEFATQQAVTDSPEIKALEVGIQQQRNNVWKADGRFIFPEASLTGDLNHEMSDETRSGTEPQNENDDWNVNLKMTYPIFDRGRRPIDSAKQRDELRRLEFIRDLRKQEIERSLRRFAYNIYNSLPSIELRRQAMTGASQNYEIVEKKYSEGIVNITELIDAQTNKFNRQAAAVVSIYTFLKDLAQFDRQLATYYMLAGDTERQAWVGKLKGYLQQKNLI